MNQVITTPLSGDTTIVSGRLKTVRLDFNDVVHEASLTNALSEILKAEADLHSAPFKHQSFHHVVRAIKNKDLEGFLLIGQTLDGRKQVAGGAIQFPTVFTEYNTSTRSFDHYAADYSEDLHFYHNYAHAFKNDLNENALGTGLGTGYTRQRIVDSTKGRRNEKPFGMVSRARIAEHATGNVAIHKVYEKFGALQETNPDKPILTFKQQPVMPAGNEYDLDVIALGMPSKAGDLINQKVFAVVWEGYNSKQSLCMSFTKAFSTYAGSPVIRAQFTSGQALPETEELQRIVFEMIEAGRCLASKRGWYKDYTGSKEIPYNSLRIHAHGEDNVSNALRSIGAVPRDVGNCRMCPSIIDFNNIPDGILGKVKLPSSTLFATYPTTIRAARDAGSTGYGRGYLSQSTQIHARAH